LLDQAQIESGQVVLKTAPFAPTDLLDMVLSTTGPLARIKELELTYEIAPDMPPILYGDLYWLCQILVNLVSNAVKFTAQGTVNIRLYLAEATQWAMQVSDTGPGIPTEAQAYIFDTFRQVDGTSTRSHTGAGLGLSIVKQLTILMGGHITLTSQVGAGSTFTICLPLVQVPEEVA
jgi:signal transduction histidine kinase